MLPLARALRVHRLELLQLGAEAAKICVEVVRRLLVALAGLHPVDDQADRAEQAAARGTGPRRDPGGDAAVIDARRVGGLVGELDLAKVALEQLLKGAVFRVAGEQQCR